MNVAAGNFNQQKNDLAAAVSNGQYSTAGSAASQTSTGNTTVNSANYAYGGTYVSLKLNADGSYKAPPTRSATSTSTPGKARPIRAAAIPATSTWTARPRAPRT